MADRGNIDLVVTNFFDFSTRSLMGGPLKADIIYLELNAYDTPSRTLMFGPLRDTSNIFGSTYDTPSRMWARFRADEVLNVVVDTKAPVFAGLSSIGSETTSSLTLSWSAATDTYTNSNSIVYDIYQADTSGGQNYSTPTYTTLSGVTSYVVTGLSEVTSYYFVVRARDLSGNRDTNAIEVSGTTAQGASAFYFFG